jgi:hypothetical protein
MRTRTLIAIIATTQLAAGCVAIYPEVDQAYGQSVLAARRTQTLNPQGVPHPVTSGIDGRASKETMDRYVDSFKAPPPAMNVMNIGGVFGQNQNSSQ